MPTFKTLGDANQLQDESGVVDAPVVVLDTEAIGSRLKKARVGLNLNQMHLAHHDEVAVSQAKCSMIEAGLWYPSILNLRYVRKIASALGLSFTNALFGVVTPQNNEIANVLAGILDENADRTRAGVAINHPYVVVPKEDYKNKKVERRSPDETANEIISENLSNSGSLKQAHDVVEVDSGTANYSPVSQQGGDNSPNQSFSNYQTTYNLRSDIVSDEYSNMVADPQSMAFKTLPVFDIDDAVKFITDSVDKGETLVSLTSRSTTFIPSNSRAYGVKVSEDIFNIDSSPILRNDVLIVEPNIKPRQSNLVVVALNAKDKNAITGVVGKLYFDIQQGMSLVCSGVDDKVTLPLGSVICGVVTEIKRDIIDPSVVKSRVDDDYDIWSTHQQ